MSHFDIEYLFFKTSLYEKIDFPENFVELFDKLFYNPKSNQFDSFCIHCQKDSTFKFTDNYISNPNFPGLPPVSIVGGDYRPKYWTSLSIPFTLTFNCQRDNSHKYSIMFITNNNKKLIKVGQEPSLATIETHNIKKYKNILKKDYVDFSKGIGLYSHGVGIGSFVYLRRIFENLIEESHQKAIINDANWDDQKYRNAKMNDKVGLLKDYLPKILVETKQLYGIISKGIHELEEDECLEMFPNIKMAIELILDEKLFKIEQEKKTVAIKKFVQTTHSDLIKR